MNKFEKIVIITTLVIGLIGGVLLLILFDKLPSIIPAIFLAMAISVLVYHFMGGLKGAKFSMGPVKMGGSLAALIGCAVVINHYLTEQKSKSFGELILNENYELLDSNNIKIGKLPLNKYIVELKDKHILLDQKIDIGTLSDSTIEKLNLTDNVCMNNYIEIQYDLEMSPYKSTLHIDRENEANIDNINSYKQLPFVLKPEFHDGSDKTMIKIKNSQNSPYYHLLKKGESFAIYSFINTKAKIYIVRVRQLDRVSPDCFANYQIFALDYNKKQRPKTKFI
jgi:hypothetical protein